LVNSTYITAITDYYLNIIIIYNNNIIVMIIVTGFHKINIQIRPSLVCAMSKNLLIYEIILFFHQRLVLQLKMVGKCILQCKTSTKWAKYST